MISSRFRKIFISLMGLTALLVLVIYAIKVYLWRDNSDFEVYYKAARLMADGNWEGVYDLKDGKSPFRYAPLTLPFVRLLAFFGHTAARELWFFFQYAVFGLCYYFVYRILKGLKKDAVLGTAFCFLLTVRFCLDSFTIGQVASLQLLGFTICLWAWMSDRPMLSGAAQMVPTFLKIGPGFSYFYFLAHIFRGGFRALLGGALAFILPVAFSALWLGSWERNTLLWQGWLTIVRNDSNYIDSSHYGSQSILSALLRITKLGILETDTVYTIWRISAVVICLAILAIWAMRKPKSKLGDGLLLSLGAFPYIWIMPQTFKYSLHMILIPLILLVARPDRRFTRFALGLMLVTLSLAGKDIIGDTLFFSNQKASVPLLTSFIVAAAAIREAFRETTPRGWKARDQSTASESASGLRKTRAR